MKNNETYYIHTWNPNEYLKTFVIIIFIIITSIGSFFANNLNSILFIFGTILIICEIAFSVHFFNKWKNEYVSKKYTKHEKPDISTYFFPVFFAILGIIFLITLFIYGIPNCYDNYLDLKRASEYQNSSIQIYSRSYDESITLLISGFIMSISVIYPFIICLIYSQFYKKYEQDIKELSIKEEKKEYNLLKTKNDISTLKTNEEMEEEYFNSMKYKLRPVERHIIEELYGFNGYTKNTPSELANKWGISQSYVSRVERSAIDKLKNRK